MKFISCTQSTYVKLRKLPFIKISGNMSQENLTLFGIFIAYSQPNMMYDDGPVEFFYCPRPLTWLF